MNNLETEESKKGMDTTLKILIAIIVLLIVIIGIITFLLYTLKADTFRVLVDGKTVSTSENFIISNDTDTYVDIQELSNLLQYQYHIGEYKVFSSDEDKCYIQSENETASFYLNSNKICKLKVGELTEDYEVFTCKNNIIKVNNKFYAPIETAKVGFNIQINSTQNQISITTLNTLLTNVDSKLNTNDKEKTYTIDTLFDNQKALLYGYIIASNSNSGLYSVLTLDGKEIVPDKYKNITFLENTKEFLVTNNLDKMGIINEDGQNKVEQLYDSIKVIGNEPKVYLVELNKKYGVINEEGNTIIHLEYDSIGINAEYAELQNQYIILDNIIPVCKNNKYGLFDIEGKKLLETQYDGIGCELESVEINGSTKSVTPVLTIEDCNGIVIKNGEVYDLFLVDEKKLLSLKVSSIYYTKENGVIKYYMIYKNKELDLIERLIKAGVIEESIPSEDTQENTLTNQIQNTATNNEVQNNINQTSQVNQASN